jgi:hypothetical protein
VAVESLAFAGATATTAAAAAAAAAAAPASRSISSAPVAAVVGIERGGFPSFHLLAEGPGPAVVGVAYEIAGFVTVTELAEVVDVGHDSFVVEVLEGVVHAVDVF